MALNLNKGEEEISKPTAGNKGLNLSKSGDSNMGKSNLSKDKSVASHVKGDKKKSSFMYLLVVLLIAFGIFWLLNQDVDTTTAAEQMPTTAEQMPTAAEQMPTAADQQSTASESLPSQDPAFTSNSLDDKALQVIRGAFGNGVARKNALGNEYDVIQAKVNELYRKGL
jgi:hypothetical protein